MTLEGRIAVVTGGGAGVDDALAQVERELGPIDVHVNNAGAVGAAHLERVMPLLETQRLQALSGGSTGTCSSTVRIST